VLGGAETFVDIALFGEKNDLRVSAAHLPTQKLGWTDAGCGAPGGSGWVWNFQLRTERVRSSVWREIRGLIGGDGFWRLAGWAMKVG
jgi:hypothetical protein